MLSLRTAKLSGAEEVNQLMKPVLCSMGLDTRDCPVDGMWTSWGKWEDCSGICGQTGLRRRYRSCTNPGPKNNGQQCPGPGSESKLCHLPGNKDIIGIIVIIVIIRVISNDNGSRTMA